MFIVPDENAKGDQGETVSEKEEVGKPWRGRVSTGFTVHTLGPSFSLPDGHSL